MPDIELLNFGTVAGSYGLIPTILTSNVVATQMVTGLTVTKEADKEVWADGVLTYTITVTNQAVQDFSNPVFTDTLDILKVTLVDDSVKIDGASVTYTYVAGLLSVVLPDLETGDSVEITFQVQTL